MSVTQFLLTCLIAFSLGIFAKSMFIKVKNVVKSILHNWTFRHKILIPYHPKQNKKDE